MFRFVYDYVLSVCKRKLNHAPIEAHGFHRVMNINEVYVYATHIRSWRNGGYVLNYMAKFYFQRYC